MELDIDTAISDLRRTIETLESQRKLQFNAVPDVGAKKKRRYPVCCKCGGHDIEVNMPCGWDYDQQDWYVERYEGAQFCHDCDEYVTLKWRRGTAPWNRKTEPQEPKRRDENE